MQPLEAFATAHTDAVDLDYLALLESDLNDNNSCVDQEIVLNGNGDSGDNA
jgi:hypothetical protein